jgi:hypothetical protein
MASASASAPTAKRITRAPRILLRSFMDPRCAYVDENIAASPQANLKLLRHDCTLGARCPRLRLTAEHTRSAASQTHRDPKRQLRRWCSGIAGIAYLHVLRGLRDLPMCAAVQMRSRQTSSFLPRLTGGDAVPTYVCTLRSSREVSMNLHLTIGPIASLIAGILILVVPRLLNYIVAIYLIIIGLVGLFGGGSFHLQ